MEKLRKMNMNTVTNRSKRIVQQFSQILQSSQKSSKLVSQFCKFEKPKLPKLNHFIIFIRITGDMLVIFLFLAQIMSKKLTSLREKRNQMLLMSEKKANHFPILSLSKS